MKTFVGTLALYFLFVSIGWAGMPVITGKPVIDAPQLLEWQTDQGTVTPALYDPTSNILLDLHGVISSCDLVLSTEGNYYPALHDIWPIFLSKFSDPPLQNAFYTTSPPITFDQIKNQILQFGNLYITCRPSVAVATKAAIDKLVDAGYTEGPVYPLYQDRGAVILVKKGNPKHIHSVWDLGRKDVRLVMPNPVIESGAFGSYLGTLYGIATHDKQPPKQMTAESLINTIFNSAGDDPYKWLAGARIHHRDLPWSVAYGKADAAIILYHLGLFTWQSFPDTFDIVPLGGTVADPQPLMGTVIRTRFIVRIKGNWSARQLEAREKLIETLLSPDFTTILEKRGLLRPVGFDSKGK
ncbi:MAG: substrate-binding domain-containing protein [Nitrospirae bacterium]|nr:substrate-binding domain-containing protein [Nitrospirota bacterium]